MLKNAVVAVLAVLTCLGASAEAGRLDWMERVYADGRHNAFTDLVNWKGQYYVCFRNAESHMSFDGEIRVMRSNDLRSWEPCGTVSTVSDDRDPHFAVAGDRLYLFFGTWDIVHMPGATLPDRGSVRSYCSYTTNGTDWSKPAGTYAPGWWLWRVTHHDGAFYSAAYTAVRPAPKARETRLLRSEDGVDWSLVSAVTNERMAGEADMHFEDDGQIWLISRTGDASGGAMFSRSDASRTNWTSRNLDVLVHSPVIAKWNDRFFVAGRGRGEEGYVTRVWELTGDPAELETVGLSEVITLPSGGDTSYPGLLADPASLTADEPALFVTWYSQHEKDAIEGGGKNTAAVYSGRIVVNSEGDGQ